MSESLMSVHHPERPTESDVREMWQINKYLWMSLGGVLLYLPFAHEQGLFVTPPWVALVIFGVAFVDGASRSYLAYRLGGRLPARLAWGYTYLDILLVAASVAITRGLESDLWLLYFVVMIFESLYATPLQKRWLDCVIVAAYLLATLPYQAYTLPQPLPWPAYWRILVTRLFFLILVSALARRISANVNARNREIALLNEQKALADDRARIAREIHDGLGHAMVSSILRLELCSRLVRKAPEEAEAILKEEVPALRAAWSEGRDLAFHLRPWEMTTDEGELIETLRRHIGRFAERTGLVVELKAEENVGRLRPQAAFSLTRIVQEALTNAAKHADATTVEVRLAPLPHGVACTIRDNGRGFDTEAEQTGMGLQAMRDRAEACGGTLEWKSAPGQGTEITVTLPT